MSLLTGPMRLHIRGHKELTLQVPVNRTIDPDMIYIPLVNGGVACTPCVNIGDEVKVGEKVAERNDRFYLPLFSSVSGSVVAIEKRMTSALVPAQHLVIQNDHKYTQVQPFQPIDFKAVGNEELLTFLKNAGMLGLGGAGFPTYVKYMNPEGVDTLIINAVECEPYLTADYKAIEENIALLKTGVLAFQKLATAKNVYIAIKEDKKDQIAALQNAFKDTDVQVKAVKNVYPMGWERTLVYEIVGKRYDRLPSEVGCIVSNATTSIAFGDALTNGMPITKKYITVSGDGVKNPQNVYVPVGTTAHDIVEACGGYTNDDVFLIAGGPMMGKTVTKDEFSIAPQNNGLTILVNRHEEAIACLRCGRCTEVCPAGLSPVNIAEAGRVKDNPRLKKLQVMDCIECGLCSYVCPSKIDVTENVRVGKRLIMTEMKMAAQAKGGK